MTQNQKILENKINIKFTNKKLLTLSLVHKSFDLLNNNEKLEFVGDRVLGLVLSKKLFNLYPRESEGNLDKKFSSLVNRKICLKISKILELEKFLILGKTYKKKIKIEDKILADACEALIGAVYLDSGFKISENFILRFWKDEIKKTVKIEIDPKTKLQEYSLKYFKKLPVYKVLSCKGPQHNPSYKISVKIHDSKLFYGIGNSKKTAEHSAARKIIKDLKIK
jgi:ribonuclease-3|tara:strand:- start:165 stop:833 length:669 start_codon:yes stop_codon:yes gene_type:complete